jgi:hypothetical protein
MTPAPLLEALTRGEVEAAVRLQVAEGAIAPRGGEQLALLVLLLSDTDARIRAAASNTLDRIPRDALEACLGSADVPAGVRDFFAARGIVPSTSSAVHLDEPLIETTRVEDENPGRIHAESPAQAVARMGFSERVKAAVKGSREMRAILIRDPSKVVAMAVLSSPKLTENEVETFARMANVCEEVLRTIAGSRTWVKNYGVVVGLTRNPKTPLALSLNLMSRLNERDLTLLSKDRNVPEPLRVAARQRVAAVKR